MNLFVPSELDWPEQGFQASTGNKIPGIAENRAHSYGGAGRTNSNKSPDSWVARVCSDRENRRQGSGCVCNPR